MLAVANVGPKRIQFSPDTRHLRKVVLDLGLNVGGRAADPVVQERQVAFGKEEALMLVLSVQIDKNRPDLPNHSKWSQSPADPALRTTLGKHVPLNVKRPVFKQQAK